MNATWLYDRMSPAARAGRVCPAGPEAGGVNRALNYIYIFSKNIRPNDILKKPKIRYLH